MRHSVIVGLVERFRAIGGTGVDGIKQSLEGRLRILCVRGVLYWILFNKIVMFRENIWSGACSEVSLQADMSSCSEKVYRPDNDLMQHPDKKKLQ